MPAEATGQGPAKRTPQNGYLLERDRELTAIDGLLQASLEGVSDALLLFGEPGLGKTRLYETALDRARAGGLTVLAAAGSELENDLALGVAGQLLRGWLTQLPADERRALMEAAPEPVRTLYEGVAVPHPSGAAHDGLAIAHGLLAILAAATETRPALLAIDDLQWCDSASLGFVLYLLQRLRELSIGLLLTSRADSDRLDRIAAHPSVRVLTLAPLGLDAVGEMVARAFGGVRGDALDAACMETTGGNPFYLSELLLALAEDPSASDQQLEQHARMLAPESVTWSLRARVGRAGSDAGALARAVAILGDDVPLRTAAALAGLRLPQAGDAADALAAATVLMPREPLCFVHPLIRTAVENDLPASQRASRHLDAARLLAEQGEDAERIAAHLLRGRPEGDCWVVGQLRHAAAAARSRGAAESAVNYLLRALAEPPPEDARSALLIDLGAAEAALGLEAADQHLAQAAGATDDPRSHAEVALLRGGALHARGLHEAAATAYQQGLDRLAAEPADEDDSTLRERLQTALLLSAVAVPSMQAEARRLSAEVMEKPPDQVHHQWQRLLLAQATVEAAFGGQPTTVVAELATRAWDGGRLLEDATPDAAAWTLISGALCLAGDLERSLEIAEAAAADARVRSAPLAFATATYMRALPELWQGDVDGALADLELARNARRYGWRQYARSAAAQYCLCMIEKGQLDDLEIALVEDGPLEPPYDGEDAVRLYALAELRRAQGRHEDAYRAALVAGEAAEVVIPYLGYCPWRCSAAQAALATGRRDEARSLIRQMRERVERTQVPHERIRALRLAGICEGGDAGLEQLREAVELGETGRRRLETIPALIALGSTLRRGGHRVEARAPLEHAVELARRGGATALAQLARTELAASGARPRREALSGPESLTASERRIAALAAGGKSNREIAALLFVTPKTVEYHLRNCYRKLGIQTRRQLAEVLPEAGSLS